jgi:hypothetical protein
MRFEVLTLAAMKVTVSWEVTPSSLVDIYQCFHECAAAILKAEAGGSTF